MDSERDIFERFFKKDRRTLRRSDASSGVVFLKKFTRASSLYFRVTESMVDFETRVFAGTPVTFAKIPGDPVKFVPLQYSLMPFPVRPFVFFLIKVYSENTP